MSDPLKRLGNSMVKVQTLLESLQKQQSGTTATLGKLQGSVQKLEANVKKLDTNVRNLQAGSALQEATMTALNGTFASIDQDLKILLADHERVDRLERRVEALEKKAG